MGFGSAIIQHFAFKYPFFMSLGAFRLKRRIFVVVVGLWAGLSLTSCGTSGTKSPPSGLLDRVLASQGVTSTSTGGGLMIINGYNDTFSLAHEIGAGGSPGLMAISPSRNLVTAFDISSNGVYAVNTASESGLGRIQLPGQTFSMVIPTSDQLGYAAVPTASVNGYSFIGAVEQMSLASPGSITTTIAVTNAQTVVTNSTGSELLVFSNDSNSVTVLFPANAVPPVDLSCLNVIPNQPVSSSAACAIVTGFDRPVNAVVGGNTAYIFNCGAECGGVQASVQAMDLSTLAVSAPIPVNGATYGLLNGSQLYVAGNGTPTGPLCTSITNAAPTAAVYCGTLDIVDLNTMTDPYYNSPTTEIAIPDGYHDQMDLNVTGQLFVGSRVCTNIGDVNNPVGEVRGCLAILNTNTGAVIFPPDNGDVNGLQGFTSRTIEYVAEGGYLRVYDTTTDALLINDFVPTGSINIVGYIGDVKAIDFF
jgi:hypothetical protein